MTSENEPRLIRPLLVMRTRGGTLTLAELRRSPQIIRQNFAIRRLADQLGLALESSIMIHRSNARYMPAEDQKLVSAIKNAQAGNETLVMDDVFRLVDCREPARANVGFSDLSRLKPPIYSVQHGKYMMRMSLLFAQQHIEDRLGQSLFKSQTIKDGIEKVREPGDGPTRKAIKKAASSKKRKADARAARLIIEIERIRATLPDGRRTDLKAIAAALNEANVPTPSSRGSWQGTMVKRVFDRVGQSLDN